MGVALGQFDDGPSLDDLAERDIDVRNITATFDLPGEYDIETLSRDLPHSEYDADKHRSLVYRPPEPKGTVVLLPPRGHVSLAGAANKDDIVGCAKQFVNDLAELGIERDVADIQVENVVATIDLERSLDLSTLTITLGLEHMEYEPEQFPGAIYRGEDAVVLLFSSGKVVITQTRTYGEVVNACEQIKDKIAGIPV